MQLLNTYDCLSSPTVKSITSIDLWLNQIEKSEYSDKITEARKFEKGSKQYEATKSKLPCVTYNFLYNGYKKDKNIIASTNLLYIDIDKIDFDIEILDKTKIFSYYKSFGGRGYSILVRVDGVNQNNFKSTYLSICDELGIGSIKDSGAIKFSQFNVLSYDENIFRNFNSYVFNSSETNFTPLSKVNKKEYIYQRMGDKIHYNNNTDYTMGLKPNEYVCDWTNGFEQIKVFIPYSRKIKVDFRYQSLLSYGTNFLHLNPHLNFYGVYNNLKHVNLTACEVPMDEKNLVKISKTLIKQRTEDVLHPIISNKKRRVIFAENSTLNRQEKQQIVNHESAKYWRGVSMSKILAIIEDWNFTKYGKITQSSIVKNYPISKKTIEKYWCEHKVYVAALNQEFNQK